MESVEKVKNDKKIPVYGIYENGGMILEKEVICFGQVDLYE